MATETEHLAKADRNANFARSLDLAALVNVEWAMTSLFYAALHYVEAYCAKVQIPDDRHNTHAKREKLFSTDKFLQTIRNEYFDLKNFSREARYECTVIQAQTVTADAVPALMAIQSRIQRELAKGP